MENFTLGAGIASLAFWGFIAAVVVGGIWYDLRKKAEQQKTIRAIVESGGNLDQEVIDAILSADKDDPIKTSKDMTMASIIVFFVGIGLLIFGVTLSFVNDKALMPLIGIGGLLFAVAGGLYLAAQFIAKKD